MDDAPVRDSGPGESAAVTSADVDSAAVAISDMLGAIRRLSDLARSGDLGGMVGALEALNEEGGPLDALGDLFDEASLWFAASGSDGLAPAVDRADDCAGMTAGLRFGVTVVTSIARAQIV